METNILTENRSTRMQARSRMSTMSLNINSCRICFEDQTYGKLIQPCDCKGTVAYIHSTCLEKWVETTHNTICQICKTPYELQSCGWKTFQEWTWPQALSSEWEDRLDFQCAILWMIYFGRFLYVHMRYGADEVNKQVQEMIGNGGFSKLWWFAFWMNLAYYGSITTLIAEKWITDNRKYQFKDKGIGKKSSQTLQISAHR